MGDPENIYYNITLSNLNEYAIPATFNESRPSAVINNIENYEMAIVRFTVPLFNVPLFTFEDNYQIQFGLYDTQDPNAGAAVSTVWLDPIPSPLPDPPPISLVAWRDDTTPATTGDNRLVYYYEQFIDMVNDQLTNLYNEFTGLVTVFDPAVNLPQVAGAPSIRYDPTTSLFSFIIPILNVAGANVTLQNVFDANNTIYRG